MGGPASSWSNAKRWKSFEDETRERGMTTFRVGPFAPKTTSGAAAADAAAHTGATACIVFNDLLAIGMLQRLRERGVRVPEDMSIVGCDDIFGADFCNPPLTTIASPIEQAGRVAVSMLLGPTQSAAGRPQPASCRHAHPPHHPRIHRPGTRSVTDTRRIPAGAAMLVECSRPR